MLDKDQYNQEDYNNYYKQESEGAEIKGYDSEEGSIKSKLVLFSGLIALVAAGYFGFKMFGSQSDKATPTQEEIAVTEERSKNEPVATREVDTENVEKSIKEEIATQVEEKMQDNQEMTKRDISKIVDLVMNKMEKETKEERDDSLLTALQESEPDSTKVETKMAVSQTINHVIQEKKDESNNYNKVTVKASSSDKDLTELSDQIRKLLNMAGEPVAPNKTASSSTATPSSTTENDGNANYATSIRKEIKTRSREMRIIIVKPGDTLNKIAKRAYGSTKSYQKIFDANPDILNRADKIYVGQKLRIPK